MTNMKIVKINEHLTTDVTKLNATKWQISGDTAKEIITKHKALKTIADQAEKLMQDTEKKVKKMLSDAHDDVWELVYKKTNTNKNNQYSIDASHADAGVLFLVEKEKKKEVSISGIDGLIDFLRSHMED